MMPTVPDIGSMTGVTPSPEMDAFTESQKPNATQILLAAATMHNQGRLVTGDSHIGFGGAMPKFSSRSPTRSPKGTRR